MAKEKKTSLFKVILIFTLVLIGLPLGTLTIIYYTNSTFEGVVNEQLRKAPGFVGEHFEKIPTNEERVEKVTDLARYYVDLEAERAAEKLYIIKKDDERLFNEVKDKMNSISSAKTKLVLSKIRNIEIIDDMLISVYGEMQQEKETAFSSEVKRLESMDINLVINEITNSIKRDSSYTKTISKIMENVDPVKGSEILFYLNETDKLNILNIVDVDKRGEFESLLAKKEFENNKLKDLAKIYEAKDTDTAFEEIGNTNSYSIDELAKIYLNLNVKKSAEILIKSEKQDFIDNLLKAIREEEKLNNKEDTVTINISQILSYLNQYNKKIDELVEIYEKMEPTSLGDVVESMLRRENKISSFEIDTHELYKVSDASIILDVLRRMNKSKVSDVLDNMTSKKAAELSRKLILD